MKYTARKDTPLIDLLGQAFHGASKSTLRQMLKFGQVKVNGIKEKSGTTLVKEGSVMEVDKQAKDDRTNAPFKLVWEDEHLLVAEKEVGVLTSGEGITRKATLHKLVDGYVREQSEGKQKAFVVHRLDKEVGGLIIFAKSEEIQQKLKEKWQGFVKKYLALTDNKPNPESGTVDTYLIERKMTMIVVPKPTQDSVRAISYYQWLRHEKHRSLIEVTLQTGKKNQIRVHMAHIGCPIVGDRKYGDATGLDLDVRLLSYYLEIMHPVLDIPLKWELVPTKRFLNPELV